MTKAITRRKPTQSRAKATVESIVTVAGQVLAEEGFGAFTMRRVAARAGVSVGSIYDYFPSRAALIYGLYEKRLSRKLKLFDEKLLKRQGPVGEKLVGYYQALMAEGLVSDLDLALRDARDRDADVSALVAKFEKALLDKYKTFLRRHSAGLSAVEASAYAKSNLAMEHAVMKLAKELKPGEAQIVARLQLNVTFDLMQDAGLDLPSDFRARLGDLFASRPPS